jgi:DUF4097 and DUF4098 domain-containing protein YvlB
MSQKRTTFVPCLVGRPRFTLASQVHIRTPKETQVRLLPLFALVAFATALPAPAPRDSFHWSGKVAEGQIVEIRGINGSIHAEPASTDRVEVIAHKTALNDDPSDIQVKVVERDGGVTVCAVGDSGECLPTSDVSVDFTVRVPRGVRFVARTVNGLVEANSLEADTEAHTVNGNVRVSTGGAAQVDTVNGSIVASVGKITSASKFSTVNGGITVTLSNSVAARVHAETVNGRIRTEFPLALRGAFPARHADGAIGRGGPELKIATVNGSIRLKHKKPV